MGQQRGTEGHPGHDEDRMHAVTRAEGPGSPGGLGRLGRAYEVRGGELGRTQWSEGAPEEGGGVGRAGRGGDPSDEDAGRLPQPTRQAGLDQP